MIRRKLVGGSSPEVGTTHQCTDAYKALVQLELFPGALSAPTSREHFGGFPPARYTVQESVYIPIEESEDAIPVHLVAGDGKSMKPTHDADGFMLEDGS